MLAETDGVYQAKPNDPCARLNIVCGRLIVRAIVIAESKEELDRAVGSVLSQVFYQTGNIGYGFLEGVSEESLDFKITDLQEPHSFQSLNLLLPNPEKAVLGGAPHD